MEAGEVLEKERGSFYAGGSENLIYDLHWDMNRLWEDKFKRLRLNNLSEVLGSVGNARGQRNNKVRRKSLRTVRTGSPPGHRDSGTSDYNCFVEKGLTHTQLF